MLRTALVGMLTAVLLVVVLPGALAGNEEYGRTWARDKVLRAGCHGYRYQYKVDPPDHEWHLETFLLDPDRKHVGAGQMHFNSDPERGSSSFRLCRNVIEPGRFKIRGKLTYGPDDDEVWIRPGFFRLRRAS